MKTSYTWGTGRRKNSVARVRITPGSGNFVINNRKIDEYFDLDRLVVEAISPMVATNSRNKFDVFVNTHGGGTTGQAGAIVMGLARALSEADTELRPVLRKGGYLTRDPRVVERKKYGLHGARRGTQFSKR